MRQAHVLGRGEETLQRGSHGRGLSKEGPPAQECPSGQNLLVFLRCHCSQTQAGNRRTS